MAAYVWQIAVALAVIFAAMRVTGVLGPLGLRWLLPLGFVLMALTPYLLLDAAGRRDIGLRRPTRARVYLVAVLAGGAAALGCFALGYALFGAGVDHWFVTIAGNYRQIVDTTGWPVVRLHLFFTIPVLIFSPIGEEILFRGYLQYALERRFSARTSTIAECAAFACRAAIRLSTQGEWLAAACHRRPCLFQPRHESHDLRLPVGAGFLLTTLVRRRFGGVSVVARERLTMGVFFCGRKP